MDTAQTQYVNQLGNAHKVAAMLVPLLEAMEINKRTEGVENLSLDEMFAKVVATAGDVYEDLLDESDKLVSTGLIYDKLLVLLSTAMRNNVVLYNSPSLELIKDDLRDLFVKHADFLQKYQNLASQASVNEGPLSELESRQIRQYSMGFIAGSLSEMFMPIWTFHANLYTSGLVDEAGMARLNSIASGYMVEVFDYVVGKMRKTQKGFANEFEISSMSLCAEMIANVVHDFNGKMIKNRSELKAYMEDPKSLLSRLLPVIYANFAALDKASSSALSSIVGES